MSYLNLYDESLNDLNQIFGKDIQYALSTINQNKPYVRIIDGFFKNGSIYITSYALANKVCHINSNQNVSLCYKLNQFQGVCSNIGHPLKEENKEIRNRLKSVFHLFYEKHVDESDINTCILKVDLSKALMFAKDQKYDIDFINKSIIVTDYIDDMVYLP